MKLGRAIKKYRKQQDISQHVLAERTGLSEVYIGYIEQDRRQNVSMKTLNKLADGLNITVTEIMREAEF